jgi:hypothetical protein
VPYGEGAWNVNDGSGLQRNRAIRRMAFLTKYLQFMPINGFLSKIKPWREA